ncbi:energy transducer TonB [Massilia sp. B-10]|nr:energy transducer TonB [Massilia sp. B-10]
MLLTHRFPAIVSALLLSLASPLAMSATLDPSDCAKPEFPARWLNEGDNGNVVVAFLVGTDGKVLDSKLVESSGYPRVDRASIRAVTSCKFKPASDQSAIAGPK